MDESEWPDSEAVTEADWLGCNDPTDLLIELQHRSMRSNRKERLFAAACCRRLWHLFPHKTSRRAVETAERYADGQVVREVPEWAAMADLSVASRHEENEIGLVVANATAFLEQGSGDLAAQELRVAALMAAGTPEEDEARAQADILRDIFGNPFRPVTIDPGWLTPDIRALGQSIYDERAFGRLPVLADALQDAGCEDEQVLAHCRGPGPHVRGCWVVDSLLGKA